MSVDTATPAGARGSKAKTAALGVATGLLT
jgi:hypothetical protein